jgi:S1-C subfamily serine protease
VVAFPNGFRSAASVLRTDQDWDLAALAIWRPNVAPVPLASLPPRPGEPLTIAGYGSGQYRMITGRCTQYVSPGYHQPFEMVELSAPARQGDSGGPIFNSRGELAGVLFGTAAGQTSGSYCGRVRAFLTSVRDQFFRLQPNPALYAQQPVANPQPTANPSPAAPASPVAASSGPGTANMAANPQPGPMPQGSQVAASRSAPPAAAIASGDTGWTSASAQPAASDPLAVLQAAVSSELLASEPSTLWNDAKNYLAVVGVGAILFHALKFLTAAGWSRNRRRRLYY